MLLITLATTFLFLSLHLFLGSGVPLLSAGFQLNDGKQWILAGLSLIRRLDCNHVTGISPQECMKIRISPASRFVAYLASREPGSSTDLRLSHPELGDELSSQNHENLTGVLVLDPLADRAFGHPLFVFRIVDISGNHDEQLRKCLDKRGLLYKNECIHQDVKPDCPFIFPSATQQDNDPKSLPGNQVCEYQFFPKVTSSEEPERNLLQCIPHASPCVSNSHQRQRRKRLYRRRVILPTYGNPVWNRDPQWINPLTRRESSNSVLPPRTVRHSPLFVFNQRVPSAEDDSICSSYDRCDHALILTSKFGDKQSVDIHFSGHSQRRNLFDKLRSLGFASRFLSVFPPEVRPRTEYHFFDLPNRIKGHYGLYGVANLLTHAIESLPLSQMVVGDIEKVSSDRTVRFSLIHTMI
nr:hypothetical transcript [Hymenolepis microstoma]